MKWHELETEQAKDLDYKIARAKEIILQALAVSKRPALAFSGGKDSTVLAHLIRGIMGEDFALLIVIYGNTGVEYPECVKFARWLAAEWKMDFHEATPGHTIEPNFKYAGQRLIWEHLIKTGNINKILKPDGKLKSTAALENSCPADLRIELEQKHMIWPSNTKMSYWWCTDQYGFPLLGKSWSKLVARRINIDTFLKYSKSISINSNLLAYYDVLRHVKISQRCCQILKKDPAEKVQSELGVDLIFKGLMASESRTRAKNFLTRGYLFEGAKRDYLHGDPFFHCQPLAIWNDTDIWNYIHRFSIPYSSLYDMTFLDINECKQNIKRNGCLGCATDFGFRNNHLFVLRQTHRKAWEVVMRAGMAQQIRNLQHTMRKGQYTLFDSIDTNELIDMQPCTFDDLDGMGGMEALSTMHYDPEV